MLIVLILPVQVTGNYVRNNTQHPALVFWAADLDVPVSGICHTTQLVSKAPCGKVCRATSLEAGWRTLGYIPDTSGQDWFDGM